MIANDSLLLVCHSRWALLIERFLAIYWPGCSQACLTKNSYNEEKCQAQIDALYECCNAFYKERGEDAKTPSCPKATLLKVKMRQRAQQSWTWRPFWYWILERDGKSLYIEPDINLLLSDRYNDRPTSIPAYWLRYLPIPLQSKLPCRKSKRAGLVVEIDKFNIRRTWARLVKHWKVRSETLIVAYRHLLKKKKEEEEERREEKNVFKEWAETY